MAKASASTFNKIINSIPAVADFTLAVPVDTTTETWVDIDTDIDDGKAWVIYGMSYYPEQITPTVPIAPLQTGGTFCIQLQRGDDSELLLSYGDDDLVLMDTWGFFAVAGSTGLNRDWPRRIAERTITMQGTLRVLYRTDVNFTGLVDTTDQIAGKLYYDVISAPNIGVSKMGSIANL